VPSPQLIVTNSDTTTSTQSKSVTASSTALSGSLDAPGAPSLDLHGERTPVGTLLKEIWSRRALLVLLVRKDFHIRYRRASFGMLWAVALPLLQSVVLAVVFSKVVRANLVAHYPAFVLMGMAPWTYFGGALSAGATGIVDQSQMSSRVYFPRAILALVSVGSNLYAFFITLVIVIAITPLLGVGLGLPLLFVFPATLLLVAFTTAICLTMSALHVYFRDVRYAVTAALLVWLYVTPVIYPPSAVPHVLRVVLAINPLTGIVGLFHQATVGSSGPLLVPAIISAAWTVALLFAGTVLQARYDRVFADLL
jgi:lipopolysaccharide transport system permease protein